eukprot:c52346_g1_i1.p1 GENE.c52346_g1_i1~~c52346_g1_i1.p1  ORF type:complete len:750 (+),score=176.32 c52346_g1_i1:179-2251(+)
MFDSQNNDKGGYSCPRAYPFPAASNAATATVDAKGKIVSSTTGDHIDTPTFFYYAGSELDMEWTNQHGCGDNENLDCRIILQYSCDSPLPASVQANPFLTSVLFNEFMRDGTPTKNDDGNNLLDEATTTIPENVNSNDCAGANCQLDGRYGYQETHAYYAWCKARSRNKGLFTADQLPIAGNNRNRAINTRQNPNGDRFGLECPEERDYYPYWTPTMWRDVAIGVTTSKLQECQTLLAPESQNVIQKCYCDMSTVQNAAQPFELDDVSCQQRSGTWRCAGMWGLPAPQCFTMKWHRDNHLGNDADGYPNQFNWTLPALPDGLDTMRCVLRLRYNVSTNDFNQTLDRRGNCEPNDMTCTNSPIIDRNNREALTYYQFLNEADDRLKLSLAVNTDQHARTFQDRTYMFDVRRQPDNVAKDCKKRLVNLNVRGKRGNIVQVYPSVEYDFAPQDVQVEQGDCVHIQWIGSDYNPNRNANDAEGGPPNPNNINEAKADRSNMVQMLDLGRSFPLKLAEIPQPFFVDSKGSPDLEMMRRFMLIDQVPNDCDSITTIQARVGNQNDRNRARRDPRNCGKLNAAKTPYFPGDVVQARAIGTHKFISTRNNNFSNRSQKLKIVVTECKTNCGNSLSGGAVAGIVIGTLAGASLVVAGAFFFFKGPRGRLNNLVKRNKKAPKPTASSVAISEPMSKKPPV